MKEGDQFQCPKTALGTEGRSRTIRPLLRKSCWAPPVHPTQHQTGEGLRHSAEVGRSLISPHKESWVCVSRRTQTSPNDSDPHTDTCQSVALEGKAPWYVTLLKEKEQSLLTLGDEITRLSKYESECVRKDKEISALREKLLEETRQLRRTNENVVRAQAELILDLTEEVRRLQSADNELQQRSQHITHLQQEVTRLQENLLLQRDLHAFDVQQKDAKSHDTNPRQEVTRANYDPSEREEPTNEEPTALIMKVETKHQSGQPSRSGVLYCQGDESSERKDRKALANAEKLITALERANQTLEHQLDEARTNHKMSSGALCSMHRTMSVKEQELLTLKTQVENLRRELKDRMTQLQTMSRKFSCLRDGRMRDELLMTLEKENYSLRQLMVKLQEEACEREQCVLRMSRQLCELEEESRGERQRRSRNKKETQKREELIRNLQLSVNAAHAALEQLQAKHERLRMKVIQAVYSAPGAKPPQREISDTAIHFTMQKIIDDRSKFYQRLVQKGEKIPALTIPEPPNAHSGSISAGGNRGSNATGL